MQNIFYLYGNNKCDGKVAKCRLYHSDPYTEGNVRKLAGFLTAGYKCTTHMATKEDPIQP